MDELTQPEASRLLQNHRREPNEQPPGFASDPLLRLVGNWTFGDADSFVSELREGRE